MVSSGAVTGDLDRLKSQKDTYISEIEGLSGTWKGPSYDNLTSKADSFISEFLTAIDTEMTAFASACDLYELYITSKTNRDISEENRQKAENQKEFFRARSFAADVRKYQGEMDTYKTQIEEQLRVASRTTLTATATTGSTFEAGATATTTGEENATLPTGNIKINGNVIDTSSPVENGTKYNLTDDELAYLAYVAKREQGSVGGTKLELSLMVNLYEKNKSKYSNVVDYVKNSGWFASRSTSSYSYPGDDYVAAAKEVVAEGNHYLTSNVVEHDCLSDIVSISSGSVNNRDDYIPGETIIKNNSGATYVFVGFAPNGGDPFGYLV